MIFLKYLSNEILKPGLPNKKNLVQNYMQQSTGPIFTVEYFGEIETEFENIIG
jgi:hypothetical protein